jgi:hypothetical protein
MHFWGDKKCLQHFGKRTLAESGRLRNLGIHAVIILNLMLKKKYDMKI